jgi:hydrocephalus-inducing protein
VDFGAVMNDTSKKKYILMENTGIIDVEYEWYFIDDGIQHETPINEVFDILPLRGKIERGVTEKVEFYYYAIPKHSFKLTAVCKTIGGP